jgi:hypothetical protein
LKEIVMRFLVVFLVLAAGNAQARDCKEPYIENKVVKGLGDFVECVNDRLAGVEEESAKQRDRVEKLEKTLAGLPGELTDVNGRVTRLGGGNLTRAGFALDGRAQQAAMGMDVDQKALEEVCGEGCSFTLVLTAIGLREDDVAPVMATGPCTFQYNAKTGAWTRGGACGALAAGVDGDGSPSGVPGGQIIAAAGDACMLADSGPRKSVDPEDQPLSRDRDKGLVLIADPSFWKGSEQRFRCDLRITR